MSKYIAGFMLGGRYCWNIFRRWKRESQPGALLQEETSLSATREIRNDTDEHRDKHEQRIYTIVHPSSFPCYLCTLRPLWKGSFICHRMSMHLKRNVISEFRHFEKLFLPRSMTRVLVYHRSTIKDINSPMYITFSSAYDL